MILLSGIAAAQRAATVRAEIASTSRPATLRAAIVAAGLWAAAAPGPAPATAQSLDRATLDELTSRQLPAAFDLYREFLALPNDAHHPEDLERVLVWLEGAFGSRGFETERLPTGGIDLLLAERTAAGADRTVLVYLQADGQPVDPGAWRQESPWQATLKERAGEGGWRELPWDRLHGAYDPEWRIFARSASDSKGPIIQFLTAVSAMDAAGASPDFDLKVIVDTEEELGSPSLPAAVERYRERLSADMLVIFDGPPHISGAPTLRFGARGIATVTLTTYGPRVPVHSGHYGNYVPNPAVRLARILASLKDEHGRVAIPGFYDGVSIDPQTREILNRVPDDEEEIQRFLGIATIDSVARTLQGAVQYPSLNVRGLRAAWVGDEARTVIPATATAELDVRLVVESDPDRLLRLVREHIEALGYQVLSGPPSEEERLRHPKLVRFESEISYGAFRTDFDSEPGRWLRGAMTRVHGEEPILIRTSGGSIPISPFVKTLGIPAVAVPTVNPDNNQHSPNENLRVADFVSGIRTILGVLTEPLPPTS